MSTKNRCRTLCQQVKALGLFVEEEFVTEIVNTTLLLRRPKLQWHHIEAGGKQCKQEVEEQNLLLHVQSLGQLQQRRSRFQDELITPRWLRQL